MLSIEKKAVVLVTINNFLFQLDEFRKLRTYTYNETQPSDEFEGQQLQNYRPVQLKSHRKIYSVQHNYTSHRDFDQMFHREGLFTTSNEYKCQANRQGLFKNLVPIHDFSHYNTRYKPLYGVP